MTIIISIEGNIGSGKSSVIEKLKKNYPNFYYLQEPVDVWTKYTIKMEKLSLIYFENNTRWAYTFQNLAYITRIQQILALKTNTMLLLQKDLFLQTECFCQNFRTRWSHKQNRKKFI